MGGISAIPFPSKQAYIELYGITRRREFLEIIGALDEAFLTAVQRVQDKQKRDGA
jgi:hypothetical protein